MIGHPRLTRKRKEGFKPLNREGAMYVKRKEEPKSPTQAKKVLHTIGVPCCGGKEREKVHLTLST